MADTKTTLQNSWEDIKREVKNSTTDNPLKKLKNDIEAQGNKGGNTIRNAFKNNDDSI